MSSFNSQLDDSYKRKDTIESSWNKLENIFSTRGTDHSFSRQSRPKSTDISKRRKIPYFVSDFNTKSTSRSGNQSPFGRRMKTTETRDTPPCRPSTVSISSLYPRAFSSPEKFSTTGLTTFQLHRIYEAKCHDLHIPVLLDQERNFFSFCSKHFMNRKFELNESGIGIEAAKAIGEVLAHNSNFAYLELQKNMMGDEGVVALAKMLCKNMYLVHLDVSSNDITPEGAAMIITIAASHPSLVSLNLSSHEGLHRNRLGVPGAIAIQKALQTNSTLGFINISGTSIGNDGVSYIIEGLKGNHSLVSLNLSNNGLGTECLEELSLSIVSSSLRSLGLSQNKLGYDGCELFANLLAGGYDGSCPLESLDLSKNEITTKGLLRLFAALRGNTQLRSLNLEKNQFSSGLSSSCQQFLADNTQLNSLNLSGCELRSEGINMLCDGLAKNHGLKVLNLSLNEIDDVGTELIANGLARNQTLKILDLSGNRIKNRGGVALANAFKINQTLEELNLKENNIKDIAGQLLSEVSRYNSNILRLNLDMNPINFKYLNDVKQNLRHNKRLHQKSLVPKLKEKLDNLQFDEGVIDEIKGKIESKKREKDEMQNKLLKINEKYEEVKYAENQRFLELSDELQKYRDVNIELSKSLDCFHLEINKEKMHGDKQVNEWGDKIANEVAAYKLMEKEKMHIKEELSLKRGQVQVTVDNFREALEREETAKRNAESTLSYIKKKLEEKKQTLNDIKYPKAPVREPKTFLASEKLASAKKQVNQSIAIESRNIESKSPSPAKLRRAKSSGRS
ncbi:PPP1R37_4 [Blepharisma stoltei]|uniref:Uncharacterized protein n=1 Tax=Blepharisma stoltei TaxID=1481888 RepID=A0AAU9IDS7_9CILI|nr:unnamed protein product [Blepharisma stoltei]